MAVTVHRWEDRFSWNEFVASVPHAHFQQGWEWGELAPQLGGHAVRLAALRDDQIVGAMQVFVYPVRPIGKTYLYVPRGPALLDPTEALAPLLDAARFLGQEERALGIKLEPNAPACSQIWRQSLPALGFRPSYPPRQPRSSWVLDILTSDADALLAHMKQKTRYNVRLARRKGIEVAEGTIADLDAFYDLYAETGRRDDFLIYPRAFYARLFAVYHESGRYCMLLARHQGELAAAITLVRLGATCWYLHGASSYQHRALMAPYLLQWEGIQWARRYGCSIYDFRAVPDVLREDQDMYGVYRFKEGFGGRQLTVLHTYAAAYRSGLFGFWQLYTTGRFRLASSMRRRKGLPARQCE